MTVTTEDATKYLTEAIPKTFPNINLMPTTVNGIKSIINSLKSKKCIHTYIFITFHGSIS
jgi:hypothetical protein